MQHFTNLRELLLDTLEEVKIYLVDDLKMTGKEALKKRNCPFFECFRKDGVIGVTEGTSDDIPALIPSKAFNINKYSLQFNNCECWMCIVKLNRNLIGKLLPRAVRLLKPSHDVVQRSCNPEVLLLEPKLFPGRDIIIRIQDSGNCFSLLLFPNRSFVVTRVELLEVKLATRRL